MIYLDYNATTPVDPAVVDAMLPFLRDGYGNPSSGHALGVAARDALEAARAQVAALIGAAPDEIIFTSGGTEASNTVLKGLAFSQFVGQVIDPTSSPVGGNPLTDPQPVKGRHFVTTVVEHPATLNPMIWLERFGFSRTEVRVDSTGLVDPDDIRRAIRSDTCLISVMHSQNEVGTLMPIAEIGRIAREAGVLFHVDAAQSIGKVPVDVREIDADFVSIAGHKFYAPKGIGALYVRRGQPPGWSARVDAPGGRTPVRPAHEAARSAGTPGQPASPPFEPFIHGASQESGRRAGTESAALAVGLGKAAELAAEHLKKCGTSPCGTGYQPVSECGTGIQPVNMPASSPCGTGFQPAKQTDSLTALRDYFWQRLSDAFGGRILLNGHPTLRLPSTLSVSFPGRVGAEILARLDGVCASTGAACHSGDPKPSRVLQAMGYSAERAVGTIRFSVGRPTSRQEIDCVVEMLTRVL